MAYRVGQANFSKGEVGEDLVARIDVAAYGTGLRRARNVTILKYGGVTKRPGTRFVAEAYQDSFDATFTGSIDGDTLTVVVDGGHPITGTIYIGMTLSGDGIPDGLTIVDFGTGAGAAGTYIVSAAQDPAIAQTEIAGTMESPVRLMPFQFSLTQTYALEMGQGYMRPAANGGLVIEDKLTIEAITLGATTMIQAAYHEYEVGDQVYLSGIEGTVELNGRVARVLSVADAAHFTIDVDSTGFSAFTADNDGTTRVGPPPPPPPPPPVPPAPPPPPPPPTGGGGGWRDGLPRYSDGSYQ